MNSLDLQLKFKSDTGESAFIEIDSVSVTEEIDTYPMEGERANDIISMIDSLEYDFAIYVDSFPSKYQTSDSNIKIYSPEYVEWLECKIKSLQ